MHCCVIPLSCVTEERHMFRSSCMPRACLRYQNGCAKCIHHSSSTSGSARLSSSSCFHPATRNDMVNVAPHVLQNVERSDVHSVRFGHKIRSLHCHWLERRNRYGCDEKICPYFRLRSCSQSSLN